MANSVSVFTYDPPPAEMDPVTAEWIIRQLSRVTNSTTVIKETTTEQEGDIEDLEYNLSAHLQDNTNPHLTRHAQLSDVAFPTILDNPHGMMRWLGNWVAGDYLKHDVVRDGDWLMIANKDTNERAAPVPTGDPAYVYQGASPTAPISAKELKIAQRYTPANDGYITGYRVYTVVGNNYRVYVVRDPDGVNEITEIFSFTAASAGWAEYTIQPLLITSGAVF